MKSDCKSGKIIFIDYLINCAEYLMMNLTVVMKDVREAREEKEKRVNGPINGGRGKRS